MINDKFEDIMPTATLTAYPRTLTDIPYSKEIYAEISKNQNISLDLIIDKLAPEIEARYKLIDRLIEQNGTTQILELASGYSARGIIFTESKDVKYVEIDLQEVAEQKKKIIEDLGIKHNNLHIESGNALNKLDFDKCQNIFDKNKKVTIINEGLLRYLDFDEKKKVAKNIYNLLSIYGGVWITCDVTPKKFIINQDKNLPNFNKNLINVVSRNNNNWRFENKEHIKTFFKEVGLKVLEFHDYSEVKDELTSPNKLRLKDSEIDPLLESAIVAVMGID
jgi:O-methyltransferase involved in polyketide biosynthesis